MHSSGSYNINHQYILCILQTTGDFNLARRCLRLCISSDGSHGAALNNLAVLAVRSGHQSKGKAYLSAARSVLPNSEEVVHNINLIEKIN